MIVALNHKSTVVGCDDADVGDGAAGTRDRPWCVCGGGGGVTMAVAVFGAGAAAEAERQSEIAGVPWSADGWPGEAGVAKGGVPTRRAGAAAELLQPARHVPLRHLIGSIV